MASKRQEGDQACRCHQGDAGCGALTVRWLSHERVRELSGEQQTKTRTVLTYFSRTLKATAIADA